MNTQNVNVKTATRESTERWGNGIKNRMLKAIDCVAMSLAYGKEAADHYGVAYGVIQSVNDGARGFIDGSKGKNQQHQGKTE